MHVALLSGEYPPAPGGIGDYTGCLAQALAEQGLKVSIITLRNKALVALQPETQIPFLASSAPVQGWNWSFWPALIDLLDQLRPQVLHLQYQTGAYTMHPALNFLPWRLHSLGARPRLVVTFHDLLVPYLFPKAGPLRAYVNHRLARDTDAVIVTNPADKAALSSRLRIAPHHIPIGSNIAVATPPGYDRQGWRASIGVKPSETLLAYFGLLSPSKGVDTLLDALVLLPPEIRLLLIGGEATANVDRDYSAAFNARLAATGLEQRVLRTGHISAERVSAHLAAADIVVLPFRDGASLRRGSLLAAMAHGCCVISTRPTDPATRALLQHDTNMYLVDHVAELPTAITTLAHDSEYRRRLAANACVFAQQFSWQRIAASHIAVYKPILAG